MTWFLHACRCCHILLPCFCLEKMPVQMLGAGWGGAFCSGGTDGALWTDRNTAYESRPPERRLGPRTERTLMLIAKCKAWSRTCKCSVECLWGPSLHLWRATQDVTLKAPCGQGNVALFPCTKRKTKRNNKQMFLRLLNCWCLINCTSFFFSSFL